MMDWILSLINEPATNTDSYFLDDSNEMSEPEKPKSRTSVAKSLITDFYNITAEERKNWKQQKL